MKACIDKACRRAGQLLRSTEFYVKSDSRDQRDVYCKECRLRRVRAAHAKAKECERNQRLAHPERKPIVITKVTDPFSMVYQAISKGLKTREEIRRATRVDYDTLGEILCTLVWECKVVRIHKRQFLMDDACAVEDVPRKGNAISRGVHIRPYENGNGCS